MEALQIWSTDSNVSILDLPDEILDDIFFQLLYVSYAYTCPVASWYDDSSILMRSITLHPLTLVCRRFNSVVTPRLYGMIDFDPGLFSYPRSWVSSVSLLQLRRIKENPALASYCRGLVVRYTDDILHYCDEANKHFMNMASLFTQTTSLRLEHSYSAQGENDCIFNILDHAACHIPTLKSLTLGSLGLMFTQPWLAAACLRRLSCHQSLTKLRVENMGPQCWEHISSQLKDLEGTANFTELEVIGSNVRDEHLRTLVNWPAQLKKVLIERQTHGDEEPLALILDPHKSSLTSIEILHSGKTGLDHLDFSEYRMLRELRLSALSPWGWHPPSRISMIRPESFATLAAPNLDVFCWDFTLPLPWGSLPFGFFSSPQEDWLRSFVDAVKSNRSSLRQIKVRFKFNAPTNWYEDCLVADVGTADGSTPYPWDYLDPMAEDFRKMGIELLYPAPNMTKDEFSELVHRLKKDPHNRPFVRVIPALVVWR